MNKKGFTLIELLVTISIMALILLMVIPSINAVKNSNKEKGYEFYAKGLIEASKVYITKEEEDLNSLGTKNWEGCIDITYQDLYDNDLIKKYDDENYDCSDAVIRYSKEGNKTSYKYNMKCINTTTSEVVFEHNDISNIGSCTMTTKDDITPPICGKITIKEAGKDDIVINPGEIKEVVETPNSRTITVECIDKYIITNKDGSTEEHQESCDAVTKTFGNTKKVDFVYITITDKAGNKTKCPVDVHINPDI